MAKLSKLSNRLNALMVSRPHKAGWYHDGAGLYLVVGITGARSWAYRYFRNGRQQNLGLGSLSTTTLAQARAKAAQCRQQRGAGIDPAAGRDAVRGALTFQQAATQYIAAKQAGWRNERHRAQWPESLTRYAFPVLGNMPASAVDTESVLKVLTPIWSKMPETAVRVRGRIESVLGWAKANGHLTGENPARWRDHLSHSLAAHTKPKLRVVHYAALPYPKLPDFMTALRLRQGTVARALEFLILTAARSGEVRGAQWDEIDLDAGMWTIPASRTKAGAEHRVPLSERALEILKTLPRTSPLLFDGHRPGKSLAHNAMRIMLTRLGHKATPHGFRSTFRDWAAETTAFPNHVVEQALAHAIGSVEGAYRRSDLFEKRRLLMDEWATYCGC
jgi:integrase